MAYSLRDGLSFCVVDGRTIFLDIHDDRYFCCPLSREAGLQEIIKGQAPTSPRTIDWLMEHRVLVTNPQAPGGLASSCIEIPQASVSSSGAGVSSMKAVTVALAAQLRAYYWLRTTPFRSVIDRLRALKARKTHIETSDEESLRGALAFHQARKLISRRDQCLPRSIALAVHLWSRGYRASLVIGVRRTPFAAHCWVQNEQLVLNDEADHVRAYTPIWVL